MLLTVNREEKEIEHHMEGYIAFMRHCRPDVVDAS